MVPKFIPRHLFSTYVNVVGWPRKEYLSEEFPITRADIHVWNYHKCRASISNECWLNHKTTSQQSPQTQTLDPLKVSQIATISWYNQSLNFQYLPTHSQEVQLALQRRPQWQDQEVALWRRQRTPEVILVNFMFFIFLLAPQVLL